jgi:hypothetical protein
LLKHEFSAFRGVLSFANGSRIIAGHFQSEKDIDAYLGLEYDVIGVEEATTLTSAEISGHFDLLPDEQAELEAAHVFNDESGWRGSRAGIGRGSCCRCWNGAKTKRGSFRRASVTMRLTIRTIGKFWRD